MKRRNLQKSIGVVLAGIIVVASGMASAHEGRDGDDKRPVCTDAKFKGGYGFSQSGSVVGIAPVPVPAADVGTFYADGKGNMSGSEVVNVGGRHFSDTFTDGKYQVNPDCTGTATWTAVFSDGSPSQIRTATFVVTDDFKQLHVLSTGPGAVLVGIARKQ